MRNALVFALTLLTWCHPLVAEKPRELWLYYPTNLQVDKNVDKLEPIWKRAAAAGYTHVLLTDSKFAKLGDLGSMTKIYFNNVERTRKIAKDLNLELVPALFNVGYSNNMLWHDPNLAEGLPVKGTLFVVKNGEARVEADPPVSISGKPGFRDESVQLNGNQATVTNPSGNSRMTWKLTVAPFRCYHVSVTIKTDNFTGQPEIKALAGKDSLQWENLGVKPTQDWKEHHVVFNSMDHTEVTVYLGVWGGAKGTLQWRDWAIEEVGLLNVLRRPGCPMVVEGLEEGKDFEPVADPLMGSKPYNGEYTSYHEPPVIKLKKNLADGTRLRVSWYHPAIIYDGQVGICPSEPKTMELLVDEATRLKKAWGTAGYMMSHDEIRSWNTCEACRKRNLDAGEILADNARACVKLLEGSRKYVWSDMFDPHHNAHGNYYLVNGDLKNSWEGLDKSVVIMNWNFGKRDQSLKFFASRGHQQIIAGYYDGPVSEVKKWLASAEKVEGVIGVMYTTWRGDYSKIEEFAKACGR